MCNQIILTPASIQMEDCYNRLYRLLQDLLSHHSHMEVVIKYCRIFNCWPRVLTKHPRTFELPSDKIKKISWLFHSCQKCFAEPGETIENFIQSETWNVKTLPWRWQTTVCSESSPDVLNRSQLKALFPTSQINGGKNLTWPKKCVGCGYGGVTSSP